MKFEDCIKENVGIYCSTKEGFSQLVNSLNSKGFIVPVVHTDWTEDKSDICLLITRNMRTIQNVTIHTAISLSTHFIYNFEKDIEH